MNRRFLFLKTSSISAVVMALIAGQGARSDEGGASFWTPGQYAALAAVPPDPGWSLPVQLYYYDGSASASQSFSRGEHVTAGMNSRTLELSLTPTYAPEGKLWGGQPSFALNWGYGLNEVDADAVISSSGMEIEQTDSLWGGTDLYPLATLAWTRDVHYWMTYLTGGIPVGAYDSKRLANIGIGHGAIDTGGAYTYFNTSNGRAFSATLGFTYNFENPHTDYRNGIDSHFDWSASQFLPGNWQVGAVGYVYYQITDDSGSGATLGGFRSKVASIGPEFGKFFSVGGQQWYANLRGYYEFWVQNRLQGYAAYASVSIPLGGK